MVSAGGLAKRFSVYFIVGCIGALFYVIIFQKPPTPDDEWNFILFGGVILIGAYFLEQLLFRKKE